MCVGYIPRIKIEIEFKGSLNPDTVEEYLQSIVNSYTYIKLINWKTKTQHKAYLKEERISK